MTIRPIVIAPDKRLRTKCAPVAAVDDEVRRLMDDMLDTMYDAPGIGLAAPQVGVLTRVVVIDLAEDDRRAPLMMANPRIVRASEEEAVRSEEHTSELQSLMRISYAVFCLEKKKKKQHGKTKTKSSN